MNLEAEQKSINCAQTNEHTIATTRLPLFQLSRLMQAASDAATLMRRSEMMKRVLLL